MINLLLNAIALFGCFWLGLFILVVCYSMLDFVLAMLFFFGGISFFIWSVSKVFALFGIS